MYLSPPYAGRGQSIGGRVEWGRGGRSLGRLVQRGRGGTVGGGYGGLQRVTEKNDPLPSSSR